MTKPYQTLNSRIAWSSPWFRIRQDEIILPNGNETVYNVVEKGTAVWILPITPDNQIVMIRNYRYTVDDWCWELPAGGVKPGQSLLDAAQDELREEVGGESDSFTPITQFYTANGICNEVGHAFLATGVTLGEPIHEPTEVMETHLFSITEALQMAQSGQISDATSALILLLWAAQQ